MPLPAPWVGGLDRESRLVPELQSSRRGGAVAAVGPVWVRARERGRGSSGRSLSTSGRFRGLAGIGGGQDRVINTGRSLLMYLVARARAGWRAGGQAHRLRAGGPRAKTFHGMGASARVAERRARARGSGARRASGGQVGGRRARRGRTHAAWAHAARASVAWAGAGAGGRAHSARGGGLGACGRSRGGGRVAPACGAGGAISASAAIAGQ